MKMKDKINKNYTLISIYVIITAVAIYILGLIATNLPTILSSILEKLNWFFRVAKPILMGFVFAYLLDPMINFFESRFQQLKILSKRQKSCRTYAIVTSLLIVVIAFTLIVSLLVYSVTNQLRVFDLDDLILLCNEYINSLNDLYQSILDQLNTLNFQSDQLKDFVSDASVYVINFLRNVGTGFVTSISNVSGYFTTFFFSLIITIYFLIDGNKLKGVIGKISDALLSDKSNNRAKDIIGTLNQVFSGYIRGQLADAFVMMFLISITLSVIGIKFSVLIGILAGIGNLIPYFGPFLAYTLTILISLLNGQYRQMFIAIIALLIVQMIDGNIIGPKLLSHSIQVHPLLVIISLMFGNAVGGLAGMLLAVPIGAFIKVMFMRFIDYRLELKALKKKSEST